MGMNSPRLLIIDIDGLCQDVFHTSLAAGRLPNLARLLGTSPLHLNPLSTFPSITFSAQTTIFTGAPPNRHGIPGNQFFDRFTPRLYAFDIGDQMAVLDALGAFTGKVGLLNEVIQPLVHTLYERAALHGLTSLVAYNMVSRGATRWLRPQVVEMARFIKGRGRLAITPAHFDGEMNAALLANIDPILPPDLITAYYTGLDHAAHNHGSAVQMPYLEETLDPLVGRLAQHLEESGWLAGALVAVVSDHGHLNVPPDDRHALHLGFPLDRELGKLFDALGLDVSDFPGEGARCNAVLSSNGGMAHVYLKHRGGEGWRAAPSFQEDVLPVARAFWQANLDGSLCADLQNALALVLVRNCEHAGGDVHPDWSAPYKVFTSLGLRSPTPYLARHPKIKTVGAAWRLADLSGMLSGDLLLLANSADGYYFGSPTTGMHGGLHPQDSQCVLSLGMPSPTAWEMHRLRAAARQVIGRRRASLADFVPVVCKWWGWEEA
jgi:hypothetical protein